MEPLIAILRDNSIGNSRGRQQVAAEALGQIRDMRALKPLIATLRGGIWTVRGQAAKALAPFGAALVAPLIAEIKGNSSNADLADMADEVLEEVLQHDAVNVALEDLCAVAHLSDTLGIMSGHDEYDSPKTFKTKVDFSNIKQLARQELIRRGSHE